MSFPLVDVDVDAFAPAVLSEPRCIVVVKPKLAFDFRLSSARGVIARLMLSIERLRLRDHFQCSEERSRLEEIGIDTVGVDGLRHREEPVHNSATPASSAPGCTHK